MDKTKQTIVINTLTEPGLIFGVGNGIATSAQSPEATAINIGMGLVCMGVRLTSELRKAGYNITLPATIDTFVQNPGAAMTANGLMGLTAAGFAAKNIDLSKPETAIPTALMLCFGAGGIAFGHSKKSGLPQMSKNFYEAAGNVLTNAGLAIAAQDAPWKIKALFAVSVAMSLYMATFNKNSGGVVQPLYANAVAATATAMSSNVPEVKVANTLWTMGYLSLDSLLKHGGPAQVFQKAKARLFGAPEHNI